MNFNDRLNIIKKDWSYIFSAKSGKIITIKNKCYRTYKPIAVFFDIYYGGPIFFVILFLFLLVPRLFDSLLMHAVMIVLLYLLIEFLIFLIIPIKKIHCWEKRLQDVYSK